MAGKPVRTMIGRLAAVALAASVLAGCTSSSVPKHLRPLPAQLISRMETLGVAQSAPIFVRIFKEESQLEVWKQRPDGQFALLKTYAICAWSGALGPKVREGDRQAPEGFYTVNPGQMNPNSSYYLSFNIGYPNAYDRSLGRTGSQLMVHGACSSAGCYSMEDAQIAEIFGMARDSLAGGQRAFQVHAFPFRMTPENMAIHRGDANMPFWNMLKDGYDHFEVTRQVPKVDVCDRQYVFDANAGTAVFDPAAACPTYEVPQAIEVAVAAKQASDQQQYTMIAARLDAAATVPGATMMAAAAPVREAAGAMIATARPSASPAPAPLTTGAIALAQAEPAPRSSMWNRLFSSRPAPAEAPAAAVRPVLAAGMPMPRPNPDRVHTAAASARPGLPVRVAAYAAVDRNAFSERVDDAFTAIFAAPVLPEAKIEAARAAR